MESLTTTVVGTGTRLEKHKCGQVGKRKVNNIAADNISSFRNGNIMQTDWMKDRWENIYAISKLTQRRTNKETEGGF